MIANKLLGYPDSARLLILNADDFGMCHATVDETGHFFSSDRVSEFFTRAKLDEVQVEFRAQIETVLAAGLTPTHLDWHSLRIARRPEIFDVMFGLA